MGMVLAQKDLAFAGYSRAMCRDYLKRAPLPQTQFAQGYRAAILFVETDGKSLDDDLRCAFLGLRVACYLAIVKDVADGLAAIGFERRASYNEAALVKLAAQVATLKGDIGAQCALLAPELMAVQS
jgi:hypothetical protein